MTFEYVVICDLKLILQQWWRQHGFDGFGRTHQFLEEGSRTHQFWERRSRNKYFEKFTAQKIEEESILA